MSLNRDRWERRPALTAILRLLVLTLPLAASAVVTVLLALLLPHPASGLPVTLWWIVLLAGGCGAALGTRQLSQRLLPLALLFELTLAFPDTAPSRLKVARKAKSVEEARRLLDGARTQSLRDAVETALALVTALEVHDRATRGHSERVRLYSDLVAEELGLGAEDRQRLRWAAIVHDIGKLHVHADILNKPGAPSDEEWEALRRHPLEGAALVAPLSPWLGRWVDAVVEHHERFDGTGYPHGRAGEQITIGGRIVAVCDAYETMTAARAYKRPLSREAAREELATCAGTHFDPRVVRAFLSLSLPEVSLRATFLAWIATLPVVAVLQRLPQRETMATAASVTGVVAVTLAGLLPGAPPPPEPAGPTAPIVAAEPRGDSGTGSRTGSPGATSSGDAAPAAMALPAPRAAEPVRIGAPPPSEPQPPPPDGGPDEIPSSYDSPISNALFLTSGQAGVDSVRRERLGLTVDAPTYDGSMPNYDIDRDGWAGLLLTPSSGPSTDGPGLVWGMEAPTGAIVASTEVTAVVYVARAQMLPTSSSLAAALLDCDATATTCETVASGSVTDRSWPWIASGLAEETISLGPLVHAVPPGNVLALALWAPADGRSVIAGFDTVTAPSRITGLTISPLNAV